MAGFCDKNCILTPFFSVLILFLFSSCSTVHVSEAITPPNYQKEIPHEGMKTHFIQLTNGEATLIELENGENILIDTGSYSSQKELFTYLNKQKITHIDHLILTNDKDEHMGNLTDLYKEIPVNNIYYPYYLEALFEEDKDLKGTKLHSLKREQEITFDARKNIKIKIVHPGESLSLSPQDNSLVFQLIHGKNRFLFTSDISEKIELELVEKFELHSQILKVSDFGSNQSSSAEFLAEVDAHVAIIFHRPDFYLKPGVLERLEEMWMDVYPIKKHGHIIIISQEDDYELFIVEAGQDLEED
jgi:competence protein ComEC